MFRYSAAQGSASGPAVLELQLIAEPSHELTWLQLLHGTFGLTVFALTGLLFSFMLAFTAVHLHIS
jgi:hypothetical protein